VVQPIICLRDINEDLVEGLTGAVCMLHLQLGFDAGCGAAALGEESVHVRVEGYAVH